jgi:hypothetical protein
VQSFSPSQVTIILEPIGNFVNLSIVGIALAFSARAQNALLPLRSHSRGSWFLEMMLRFAIDDGVQRLQFAVG